MNLAIVALHLQIAFLFWFRHPIDRSTSWRGLSIGLLSLVTGGLVLRMAPPLDQWSTAQNVLFVSATLWVLCSFFFLGRSFAILPVARKLVANGPYRWLRHPAYFGESLMLLTAVLASGSVVSWTCLAAALIAIVFRIREEEYLLDNRLAYDQYSSQVRYRLIPFVW